MIKECLNCNKEFKVKPSHFNKRFYCSMGCLSEHFKIRMKGENNPNYRNVIKFCQVCNKEYKNYSKKSKYCSWRCAGMSTQNKEKLKVMAKMQRKKSTVPRERKAKLSKIKIVNCKSCGSLIVNHKKCHRVYCTNCFKVRLPKPCIICGKVFKTKNDKKTCSRECHLIHLSRRQKGEKSHLWQGGKTDALMLKRTSAEYGAWRKSVFERDDYTCQHCGKRGNKLHADHIYPVSIYPELIYELSNGRTLCIECHRKTPTWGFKAVYQKQRVESVTDILKIINS